MSSKRYKKLLEKTRDLQSAEVAKLIPILKQNCTTKFDESLDLSLQINNKQKKSEINIRTVINLPGGSSKKVKVGVVCEDNKSQEAKDAGAEVVGGDELIEEIKAGNINFEKLICTPGMMIKLSKLGKILGPKGLMPNPKLGSVTNDLKKAIVDADKLNDFVSRELFRTILDSEEEHVDVIETHLNLVNKVGKENWLQSQI